MASGFKNKVKAIWAFIKHTAIRVFNYLKVAKMEWIVIIAVFIIDLVSKSLVENFLDFNQSVPMIPYFLNAHKVHNYSAAFGSSWLRGWMGDIGARIFFCVFAVAASVAFILVLIRNKGKSRVFRIAIALFVAGAMGNCIDRMALGYVRDFIEFEYFGLTIAGSKTWAYIFNIADVALVSGVILIIFYFLFLYRDHDKKKIEFTIDSDTETDSGELRKQAEAASVAASETNGNEDGVADEAENNIEIDDNESGEEQSATEVENNVVAPNENNESKDTISDIGGETD